MLIIILLLSAFVRAETNTDELISINLKDVELETALIMLANTADRNLICDSSVNGKITVIFNDIPFKKALDLITDSFNLVYSSENQIIYVSTEEKMAAKKKNFVSKNYKFQNLSSELAADILKNNFEEIEIIDLNSDGLIITSEEKKVKELEKIISQIDQPQKQIMIRARIEEISRTKIKELGINPNQLTELKIIKDDGGDIEKLNPGWPDTLKALNEQGLSNILANPSLMTLDRKKAKLVIGDQIPVKLEKVESEKTVSTINYIEAGIVLEFLPRIINQNQVLLEIKPSVNSIGQVLADGLPAVNSRSAETTVILENGQTLAIGGLIKKDELKTVKEVPLLADLPVLGSLFSSSENTDIETELIIFITPEIIETKKITVQEKETEADHKSKSKKIEAEKEEITGEKKNKNNRKFKRLTEKELEEILNK
ncbi:MAG: type II and III secretion system protein [Halanaerobium sp.]